MRDSALRLRGLPQGSPRSRPVALDRRRTALFAARSRSSRSTAAVDSFLAPEPGTGPGRPPARGLLTLALLGARARALPAAAGRRRGRRSRPSLGALALEGAVLAIARRPRGRRPRRGLDRLPARPGRPGPARPRGHALLWRSRKPGRLRWLRRGGLAARDRRRGLLARRAGRDRDPRHAPPPRRRRRRSISAGPIKQVTVRTSRRTRSSPAGTSARKTAPP